MGQGSAGLGVQVKPVRVISELFLFLSSVNLHAHDRETSVCSMPFETICLNACH